ncbi:hypothetical protein NC651_000502 [Populus alba x Populus x berolinensis]|nr:hypothetical protein NC651_000502 [Populus alba x Populus x berolinensis]
MCMEREKQALLKLKDDLVDENDHLSSWGTGGDCCNWTGVRCNNRTGHVYSLQLNQQADYSIKFKGDISSPLLELKHLAYLDMSTINNPNGGSLVSLFLACAAAPRMACCSSRDPSGELNLVHGTLRRRYELSLMSYTIY